MSVQALSWAIKQQVGDGIAKLILILLADHADESDECFSSLRLLGINSEQSKSTILRKIQYLADADMIEVNHRVDDAGRNSANSYRLLTTHGVTVTPPGITADTTRSLTKLKKKEEGEEEREGEERRFSLQSNGDDTPPMKKPKRGKSTPLPDDFKPTDRNILWAATIISPSRIPIETEKFCDHARANGRLAIDWQAAWRNWIRIAAERQPPQQPRPPRAHPSIV